MRSPQRVEVSIAKDPDGNPAVLLQLPYGWVFMQPEDARVLAVALTEVADEFDDTIQRLLRHKMAVKQPKGSP